MFIRNGLIKFDSEGFWTQPFLETWGFPLWFLYFIGVLEILGGLLLLIPKFRPWGSLMLIFVMLGAVLTRMFFGIKNGVSGDNVYAIINNLDLIFFVSTIAIFLYFISNRKTDFSEQFNTD